MKQDLKFPKKLKKPSRKKLVKDLDKVFSEYIRQKWSGSFNRCFFCPEQIEHCFHIVTRAKYSLRWEPDNALASCRSCNYRYEFDPHPFIKKIIDNFGKDFYYNLIERGNKIGKFSDSDLIEKIEDFKQDLKELKGA